MQRLVFDCEHTYPSGFRLCAKFELHSQVTALFGPSGAGKSTILSILAGTLRPHRGRVDFDDRVLLDTAQKRFLPPEQRQIGCVFQEPRLFPHLSIEQNLRFGLRRAAAPRVEFARAVDVLELGGMLNRYPRSLSGGERQRVALGRAILQSPQLLLMDEPLTALDAGLKGRILDYLERVLHEWELPTLLVSHNLGDVQRLARSVLHVEQGKITSATDVQRAASEGSPPST